MLLWRWHPAWMEHGGGYCFAGGKGGGRVGGIQQAGGRRLAGPFPHNACDEAEDHWDARCIVPLPVCNVPRWQDLLYTVCAHPSLR